MEDVTAASVRRAIAEFDSMGREAFLAKYEFGKARDYFIAQNGRRYDSKAILGAAHGYLGRRPLKPSDFYGGERNTARHLQEIGFDVTSPANRRIGKQEMIERLGARLTNVRWGWDATMPDGSVVFIGWNHQVERGPSGTVQRCEVYRHGRPNNTSAGGRERWRHIQEVLSTGTGYLVLATAKDPTIHPHQIESVDDQLYTVRLEQVGEVIFAVVVAANSAPELPDTDLAADIRMIEASTEIPETEKLQLIRARRGQGTFRSRLELLEPCCRLTGVADRAHLRASHIKPWRDSSNAERLDGANGLLLAPHVDHLFDQGFISFEDDGTLLVSPRLDPSVLVSWGITRTRGTGTFSPAQCDYLAHHRNKIFMKPGLGG